MVTLLLRGCALTLMAMLVTVPATHAADAGNPGIDAGHAGYAATGPAPPLVQGWSRPELKVHVLQPVAAGGSVFVATTSLLALDSASGATRWTAPSTAGQIAAAGGRVFTGTPPGFAIGAVDATTGAARWTDTQTMFTGPVADAGLAVVSGVLGTRALDATTGKLLWEARADGVGDLALDSARVYALTGGKSGCVARAYRRDALLGLPVQVWATPCGNTTFGMSIVVSAGRVHVEGLVLDAATGRKLHDLPRPIEAGGLAAAPDGTAFVTGDGEVVAYAPSGSRRWRTAVAGASAGSPLIVGSRVFAATKDGTLRAFDAATGAVVWSATTPLREFVGMTISDDTLIVAGDQGVFAFVPAVVDSLMALALRLRRGQLAAVAVRIRLQRAAAVRTIVYRGTRVLARRALQVGAGRRTVRVPLTGTQVRSMRRARTRSLRIVVEARAADGTSQRTSRRIAVRR